MTGKLRNVEEEMSQLNTDILGLNEKHIYYLGENDTHHRYGTVISVLNEIAKSVIKFAPLNNRVVLLQLETAHRKIIHSYAPTNDKTENKVKDFYVTLDEVTKLTKNGKITMVLGDFNSKLEHSAKGVGAFGLGDRNSDRDRLVQFCTENHLFAANTFFKQYNRRLYTWKSPMNCEGRDIKNKIDFILLILRKYVKSVRKNIPRCRCQQRSQPSCHGLQIQEIH
ncbi:hypothetical protein ACFW04_011824 [Cataglyphis niger]